MLMVTRELLLKEHGYKVISVFGDEAAKEILSRGAQYDLFIGGHAATDQRRRRVVQWLKASFPNVKILALNPPHHGSVSSADYNIPLNRQRNGCEQ
jgi:hypothetical protein